MNLRRGFRTTRIVIMRVKIGGIPQSLFFTLLGLLNLRLKEILARCGFGIAGLLLNGFLQVNPDCNALLAIR
jgi:hypothetical protein